MNTNNSGIHVLQRMDFSDFATLEILSIFSCALDVRCVMLLFLFGVYTPFS